MKKGKITVIILLAMVLSLAQISSLVGGEECNSAVYAAMRVKSEILGTSSVMQGDKGQVLVVQITNLQNGNFVFDKSSLTSSPSRGISIAGETTGQITLQKDEMATLTFYLSADRDAGTGSRSLNLILYNNGEEVLNDENLGTFTVYESTAEPEGNKNYVMAVEMVHATKPKEGFSEGSENEISITVRNNGNSTIRNGEIKLNLPEGLSINNSSNAVTLGYLSSSVTRQVNFPILVDEGVESKNYAIEAELTGADSSSNPVSFKRTFYVPVEGTGSKTALKDLEISNIHVPSQVYGKDEFTLSFRLTNTSAAAIKDLKVYGTMPEGILNKTKDTFVEKRLNAGESKEYSITMFAVDGSKEKSYPIKLAAALTEKDALDSAVQYASVLVKPEAGNGKKPQLMVEEYTYGGTHVQAGDEFLLNLTLYNTSPTYELTNIKVTLTAEEGAFVPVGGSNAFFIDTLGTKERISRSVLLSSLPESKQKATMLTVEMMYEDGSGNELTAKDIISIPIVQETRLAVDDPVIPPDVFVGQSSYASMEFYNMGKMELTNLRVRAEGNFDAQGTLSYYVGNLESGKSDSFDFSFIPREGGLMEGKAIFTYEDATGKEMSYEKPFSIEVMDEMPMFEEEFPPGKMPQEAEKAWVKPVIALVVILLLAIVAIIVWKIWKKKKLQREMEIDE